MAWLNACHEQGGKRVNDMPFWRFKSTGRSNRAIHKIQWKMGCVCVCVRGISISYEDEVINGRQKRANKPNNRSTCQRMNGKENTQQHTSTYTENYTREKKNLFNFGWSVFPFCACIGASRICSCISVIPSFSCSDCSFKTILCSDIINSTLCPYYVMTV